MAAYGSVAVTNSAKRVDRNGRIGNSLKFGLSGRNLEPLIASALHWSRHSNKDLGCLYHRLNLRKMDTIPLSLHFN